MSNSVLDKTCHDAEKISAEGDILTVENCSESLEPRQLKMDHPRSIVLSPQPTDDPNDPLNWPAWAKWLMLCVVALGALQTPLNATITVAAFEPLASKWNSSIVHVSYLISIGVIPNVLGVSLLYVHEVLESFKHSCLLYGNVAPVLRPTYHQK